MLTAPLAAAYIGVGQTKLRELGIRRKELGGKRLYDVNDLDAFADALPYEGEDAEGESENSCDEVFD